MTAPAAASVRVANDQDLITTIERFDVPADQQEQALESAGARVEEWQRDGEFVGAALLREFPDGGLTSYVQWRRPATGHRVATPSGDRSLTATLHSFTPLDSRNYELDFISTAPSVTPPLQMSPPQTPFAHFGRFTVAPEHQQELLDLAYDDSPSSLDVAGLLCVSFHRSIDGAQVINLGVWTTFDHRDELSARPEFSAENNYWSSVAVWHPHQYEIAAVYAGGVA